MLATAMFAGAPSWESGNRVRTAREGVLEAARKVQETYAKLCQCKVVGKSEDPQPIIWPKFARAVAPFFPAGTGKIERLIFELALQVIRFTKFRSLPPPEKPKVVQAPVPRIRAGKTKRPSNPLPVPKPLPRYTIPARILRTRQVLAAWTIAKHIPPRFHHVRCAWLRPQVLLLTRRIVPHYAAKTPVAYRIAKSLLQGFPRGGNARKNLEKNQENSRGKPKSRLPLNTSIQ